MVYLWNSFNTMFHCRLDNDYTLLSSEHLHQITFTFSSAHVDYLYVCQHLHVPHVYRMYAT